MRKIGLGGAIVIAFVIGCAASQIVMPAAVPVASAEVPWQAWEYNCTTAAFQQRPGGGGMELTGAFREELRRLGQERWELVTTDVVNGVTANYCFKRPLP